MAEKVASGAGALVSFLVPSVGATRLIGSIPTMANFAVRFAPTIGTAVSTVLEAATEAGGKFQEEIGKGTNKKEASQIAAKVFSSNVILLALTNRFGIFGDKLKGAAKALASAPLEGIQEGTQEFISSFMSGEPTDWPTVFENAGIGAVIGGVAGPIIDVSGSKVGSQTVGEKGIQYLQENYPKLSQSVKDQVFPVEGKELNEIMSKSVAAGEEIKIRGGTQQEADNVAEEVLQEQMRPILEQRQRDLDAEVAKKEISTSSKTPEDIFTLQPDIEALEQGQKIEAKSLEQLAEERKAQGLDVGATEVTEEEIDTGIAQVEEEKIGEAVDVAREELGISQISRISEADINKQAKELREKFIEDNPDTKVPPLEEFKETARETAEEAGVAVQKTDAGLKKKVREVTGISRPEPKILTEKQALKLVLQTQVKAARTAKRFTVKQLTDVKRELRDLVNENIPLSERGKFLSSVATIKEPAQLEDAVKRIDEFTSRLEKKSAVKELKSTISSINLKKMRPEFKAKLDPIIEGIDPTKLSQGKISDLQSLAEAVSNEEGNQIPEKRLNELKRLEKKNVDTLTKEEVQEISDTLNHLVNLNNLKNRLIIKGKLREAGEVSDEAIKNVQRKTEKRALSIDGLDSTQEEEDLSIFGRIIQFFTVGSYNAELKTEILDSQEKGIIRETIFNEIDRGVSRQLEHEQQAEDFFRSEFKEIPIDNWSEVFQKDQKKVIRQSFKLQSGLTVSLTKAEKVALLLHSQNDNNLRHLLEGGFSFNKTPSRIIKITQEDLTNILNTITKDEQIVADSTHEYFNNIQKDNINEVSIDLNGHEIAREEDYFPIRTNFLDRFKDKLIKADNFSQKTLEGLGIFKERQSAGNALILDDVFLASYKSVRQVAAYVGLAQPLRTAKTLLQGNEFQKEVRQAGKAGYLKSLESYIQRIEDNSMQLDNADKLTQEFINRLDVAILGLNPFVMLKQPVSFALAATEIDSKYLLKAATQLVNQKLIDEITENSPQLRDRFAGKISREVGEVASVGGPRKMFTNKNTISQKFMAGIQKFDQAAISRIWLAAKLEQQDKGLKGKELLEATQERAEEIIRKTQPTFHIKDRSDIGSSKQFFIRLFTKYSSQRNKNFMILRRSFEKYNRSGKTTKDKSSLAKNVSFVTILAPLMLMGIDESRDILYSKEQKKNIFNRSLDFISLTFGNIYILGNAFNAFKSQIEKGTWAGYDIDDPVTQTANQIVSTIVTAVDGIGQAVSGERYKVGKKRGEEKWKSSLSRVMRNSLDLAGKLKGIPVATVRKFLTIPFKKKEKKPRFKL